MAKKDEMPDDGFTDRVAAELLRPGSGWRSANGRTRENAERVDFRLWERETKGGGRR
ncbi:hypothetical protein AB0F81_29750 [Actinoplanes sp. NPDC024001]|uniref:hypothetical protein n=1 Tax=Actinoplanes sp. NPDC024001 TaxID=3154598 RepID=UPI0033D970C4